MTVIKDLEQDIARMEREIDRLVQSPTDDASDRDAQILAHFEPNLRERVVQILINIDNIRDWLTAESQDNAAIHVSAHTPSERFKFSYRLATDKADDIAKSAMPWEEALDRVRLTQYGVDIPQILAHFKPNSQQLVAEALSDPRWDSYRAGSLRDLSPGDAQPVEDLLVVTCHLYRTGRGHLAEIVRISA